MKTTNTTEEELIRGHLETHYPILEYFNKIKIYFPSFLFSWQERLQRILSNYITIDSDNIDDDKQLKNAMKYIWYMIGGIVVISLILIY